MVWCEVDSSGSKYATVVDSSEHSNNHFGSIKCETLLNYTSNYSKYIIRFNPLNTQLNPVCLPLALLGAHRIPHFSEIGVKNMEWYLFNCRCNAFKLLPLACLLKINTDIIFHTVVTDTLPWFWIRLQDLDDMHICVHGKGKDYMILRFRRWALPRNIWQILI